VQASGWQGAVHRIGASLHSRPQGNVRVCASIWLAMLFTELVRLYTATHREMVESVKASGWQGCSQDWCVFTQPPTEKRSSLCKHLAGKALFTGLVRLYTATLREMIQSVQADHSDKQQTDDHEGFRLQRRRKRSSLCDQQKQMTKSRQADHWNQGPADTVAAGASYTQLFRAPKDSRHGARIRRGHRRPAAAASHYAYICN
jgi:hypothetical protein